MRFATIYQLVHDKKKSTTCLKKSYVKNPLIDFTYENLKEAKPTLFTKLWKRWKISLGGYIIVGQKSFHHLNFERVNVPKDHPARDMQDSFLY